MSTSPRTHEHTRQSVKPSPAGTAARASSGAAHPLIGLQQSIGNRAVGHLLRSRLPGSPSDKGQQRETACDGCPDEQLLQRETTDSAALSAAPPIVHGVLRTPGQPLDPGARGLMESRFNYDFSGVRLHTGWQAAESARAVHARAYTVGQDVVFGAGAYSPGSAGGMRLLAHELTHVVQQGGALMASTIQIGAPGDRFEQEADAAARAVLAGDQPRVTQRTGLTTQLQRLALSEFDPNDINPQQAVADPDYIDNGLLDGGLRSNGSVMNPVFLGFTLFYQDGSIMDIPAAANSSFPAFKVPSGGTMTYYRRHTQTGKIFPITIASSDFLAAPDLETARQNHSQFLFYRLITPGIMTLFDNAIARVAFAYAGLIAQIWNLGLGIRGGIQIFTLSGAMRAMAAGRASAQGAAAARSAAGQGATQTVQQTLAAIQRAVLKNTVTSAQLTLIQRIEVRLVSIVQRAIQNVGNGTAIGPWAQRLARLVPTDRMYRLTLGNAIHEESFTLIQREIQAGTLPAGLRTNIGRAVPNAGLTNAYTGRLRPDIRLPLGAGDEAVFDITTVAQQGHAQPYGNFSFVKYVVELLYP